MKGRSARSGDGFPNILWTMKTEKVLMRVKSRLDIGKREVIVPADFRQ